jgi:thiamine biosynthesis protein ThiI
MYRVAAEIAKKEKAIALVTGENLGQVASQTLDNLYVLNDAVKIPIIRPLIGLDKEETICIAKKTKTYEISISPGINCTLVPKYPETHAEMKFIKNEEKKLDLKKLVQNALNSSEVVEL